jgi:hypothetical protein
VKPVLCCLRLQVRYLPADRVQGSTAAAASTPPRIAGSGRVGEVRDTGAGRCGDEASRQHDVQRQAQGRGLRAAGEMPTVTC